MANTLAQEVTPKDAMQVNVINSTAAQSKYLHLRDKNCDSHWQMMRHVCGGISKSTAKRLHERIEAIEDTMEQEAVNHPALHEMKKQQIELIVKTMEKHTSTDKEKPWPKKYHDAHQL